MDSPHSEPGAGFAEDERELLRDSVRRVTADLYGFDQRRAVLEAGGYSGPAWRTMADLGWLGIGLPAESGGAGGDVHDLAIVMEGIGRAIMLEPFLSTVVIGAQLVHRVATPDQRERILGPLAAGETVLALAHAEPELGFARAPIATVADGGLTGRKSFVLDGPHADQLLVTARDGAGRVGLHLVARDAPGLALVPFRTIDGRAAAELTLKGTPSERLGGGGDIFEALDAALDTATVALGAEAVGAMASVVEMTGEQLRSRHQFGRPLASFQVLRHRLVDMHIGVEETRAMIEVAAATLDGPAAQRRAAVSACKVQICRAARFVGQQGVQMHGGMGMTDELAISHYFKRLMMVEALFGDAEFHLGRYAAAAASA